MRIRGLLATGVALVCVSACGGDDEGSGGKAGTGGLGGSAGQSGGAAGSSTGGVAGSQPTGCGDGITVLPEECDDDNTVDNDGCDSDCVPSRVTQIAAAPQHTCALTRRGTVRCWGNGENGRLGYGNTNDIGDNETPASAGDVDLGGTATQIAVGEAHTCALLDTGAVRCWGAGGAGRLGYGNTDDVGDTESPAFAGDVDLGAKASQVAAGADHTCALLDTGALRCWGGNGTGQLGRGDDVAIGDTELPSSAPPVDLGSPAVLSVAAGYGHTCALLDGGALRCWGSNSVGQIGTGIAGTIGDNELPTSIPPVDVGFDVVSLAAVYGTTCVLSAAGAIRCWGLGANGECGYGNTDNIGDTETPESAGDIDIGGIVTQVNAGPCALLDTGKMRCWGLGATGALGHANTDNIGDTETPASAGDIDVGGTVVYQHSDGIHACAILDTGAVRCWGHGEFGMLGSGSTQNIGDNELPSSAPPVTVF